MIHFYQREKTNQSEIISPDNFIALAEVITIRTTRIVGIKNIRCKNRYNNLIKDIFHSDEEGYILSDSYDLLQEVSLILSQNIGKRLSDIIYCDNKPIPIFKFCTKTICHLIYENNKYYKNTRAIIPKKDRYVVYEENDYSDYAKADEILSALDLSDKQLTLLNCYMADMTYMEIVKYLNLPKSSPWSLRYQIRRKYIKTFGDI